MTMAKKKSDPVPRMTGGKAEEAKDLGRGLGGRTSQKPPPEREVLERVGKKPTASDKEAGIPSGIPTYDPSRKRGGK
jgi:hypothetical protein